VVSFDISNNPQLSGGGSNFFKKVPHMERVLSYLIRVEQ